MTDRNKIAILLFLALTILVSALGVAIAPRPDRGVVASTSSSAPP